MLKKIKGFFTMVSILIMVAWMGCGNDFCPAAKADVIDGLHNSTATGWIMDGAEGRELYLENITIYEPSGQEFLGIPLTKARLKLVSTDGKEIIHDVLMIAQLSQPTDPDDKPTFYLCYRILSEPFAINAGGILYDFATHWWGKDAPPVHLGLLYGDNGNPIYTLYLDYDLNRILGESANGYSVGADVIMGMEGIGNRDFLDYELWGKKDTDAEGKTFIKASILNYGGYTVYTISTGFTF